MLHINLGNIMYFILPFGLQVLNDECPSVAQEWAMTPTLLTGRTPRSGSAM